MIPSDQYIWGAYIDEFIQQKDLVAISGFASNAELYPFQDLLYRTTALTDSSGSIIEAYDYDAYGNTLIFRATGSPPAALAFTDADPQVESPTCQHLYTGRRYDAESQNYNFRERYYGTRLSRFLSRDPILYLGDSLNLFCYISSNPILTTDPTGLVGQAFMGTHSLREGERRAKEMRKRLLEKTRNMDKVIAKVKETWGADFYVWAELKNMRFVQLGTVYTHIQPKFTTGIEFLEDMPVELVGKIDSSKANVESLIDNIETHLKKIDKPCLNTLVVSGHGVDGVGASLGDGQFKASTLEGANAEKLRSLLCENAAVIIMSCESNTFRETQTDRKRLANLLKATVYSCPSGHSATNSPYGCERNKKTWYGWHRSPKLDSILFSRVFWPDAGRGLILDEEATREA
jgi:RHS repeat-associated protein